MRALALAALAAGLALAAGPVRAQAPGGSTPAPAAEPGPMDPGHGAPEPGEEERAFAREDVRAVAERIVCYCGCPHLQVSKCFCGTADDIRDDIARQLDAGMTPDAIVAAYVEEHGTYGLAVPPREGFNWIIWAGPAALLALGLLLVILLGRRWRTAEGDLVPAGPVPVLDPESEERVRAELARSLRDLD